jgi:hypothetical protein
MKKTLMLLVVFISLPASAETVLRCAGIDGNAFYVGEKSWVKDGGAGIKLNLVKNGNDYDVLIGDAGGLETIRNMGGDVYPLGSTDGLFTILAAYGGGHAELYTFDLQRKKLFLSQHKTLGLIKKVAAYQGDCF